jgi:hypothetical protein
MFSLVIPSMWKYPPFFQFLEDLLRLELVDDVILIDNNELHRPSLSHLFNNPKLRMPYTSYTQPGTNIGCNAAWNLGVERAKNENVCVMNDDIIFDIRAFYRANFHLSEAKPLIGMSAGDPKHGQPPVTDGTIDLTQWKPGMHTHGFGCLFFVRKSWWIPIPDGLFNYFGDNWAFDTTLIRRKPVHLLTNFMYSTPFAQTMKDFPNNQEMLMKEHRIYYNALDEWKKTL